MRTKTVFGLVVLVLVCVPAVLQWSKVIKVEALTGEFEPLQDTLSWSWWNRDFQKRMQHWSTDSLYIHPTCVRIRNQFEFSLANKVNARDLYVHNGIFFRFPVPDYNEQSFFKGETHISEKVKDLVRIQREQLHDSVPIYVVIPPFKSAYFNAVLPVYNRGNNGLSNYKLYVRELKAQGIQLLDANAWFCAESATQRKAHPPIFGKGGVHWSLYAATLVMDSLMRQIAVNQKLQTPQLRYHLSSGKEVYEEDQDASNLANLYFRPKDNNLKVVYFDGFPGASAPRLRPMIISDSYFHVVSWTPMHDFLFDPETPFYYYFHTRFTRNGAGVKRDLQVVKQDLKQADCIIIISDVMNLEQFGFGFIESQLKP